MLHGPGRSNSVALSNRPVLCHCLYNTHSKRKAKLAWLHPPWHSKQATFASNISKHNVAIGSLGRTIKAEKRNRRLDTDEQKQQQQTLTNTQQQLSCPTLPKESSGDFEGICKMEKPIKKGKKPLLVPLPRTRKARM